MARAAMPAAAQPEPAAAEPSAGVDADSPNSVVEEMLDAKEELEEFRNTAIPELKNYRPSSGTGQFDVACNMRTGTMTITLKVGFNFVDGYGGHVGQGFKPEEFKWKPEEIEAWKARYLRDIGSRWSGKFAIKSTRKYWESMIVNTTVRVADDAAAQHFKVWVGKYPSDAIPIESAVSRPGTHYDRMTGKLMTNADSDDITGSAELDSNDTRDEPKVDKDAASIGIAFDEGSAILSPDARKAVAGIASSLSGSSHVELTGHSNKKHDPEVNETDGAIASMGLARERTAAVQAELIARGATRDQILVRNAGENGAGAGTEWCRVDVKVGTHEMQTTTVHEAGHMLGSSDEYDTGKPNANYTAMVKAQTGDTLAVATNENAMSVGATVRRWNYAAFLEALKAATGTSEWSL